MKRQGKIRWIAWFFPLALLCGACAAKSDSHPEQSEMEFVANGVEVMRKALKSSAKYRGLESLTEDQKSSLMLYYQSLTRERAMLQSALARMPAQSVPARELGAFLQKWTDETIEQALIAAPVRGGFDDHVAALARTFRASHWKTLFPLFRP